MNNGVRPECHLGLLLLKLEEKLSYYGDTDAIKVMGLHPDMEGIDR